MKSALVLAAAAGAVAQNFAGIPACALPCITSAITAVGCQATDVACQCGPSQQAIVNTAGACVLNGCAATPSAIQEAITAGSSLCRAYSATAGSGSAVTTSTGSVSTGTVTTGASRTTTGPSATITTGIATTRTNNTVTTSGGSSSATNRPTGPSTSGSSISTTTQGGAAATVGAGALIGLLGLVAAL